MIVDIIRDTAPKDILKDGWQGALKAMGSDALLDMVNTIKWDIENVKGGNYIEVEVIHTPIDDQTGEYQYAFQLGAFPITQTIRYYEVDGVYVCDPNNQLNYTVYGFESRPGEFLFEQQPSS